MNIQSLLYKKLLKRCFHSSSIQEKRKSGALAFDAPVRGLSKKQKKRKARRLVMQSEVKDQKKEKIKANHLARQLASDGPKQYLHDSVEKLKGVFTELFLPDGTNRLYEDDVGVDGLPKPVVRRDFKDAHMILYSLRNNKAKQDLLLSANSEEQHTVQLEVDSTSKLSIKNNELVDIDSMSVQDADIHNAITPSNQDVGDVINYFANYKKFTELTETVTLLNALDIPVAPKLWSVMMKNASKSRRYQLAEDYFDLMIKSNVEPDQWTWSALVHAKVKGRGTEAAMEQIEILKRTGVQPTVHMFTTVLNSLLDEKKWPEAHDLWIRMHCEGITLSVEAFTSMLRHSIGTNCAERAFFYIDEMQALNLEPDLRTYQMLFRAVAEAPHWVDGYHDIIFDAMCKIEGAELKPDTAIYNTVIYAFARAGDSAAAEYYFWEMRRKGLEQNDVTYNSLMNAYAVSQTVGAKAYGTMGRFVKPREREDTADEKAYKDIGAKKAFEMMSKGLSQDFNLERGNRQKTKLEDVFDLDDEAEADLLEDVHMEAKAINEKRGELIQKYYLNDQIQTEIDFEQLGENDAGLKQMMLDMRRERDEEIEFKRRDEEDERKLERRKQVHQEKTKAIQGKMSAKDEEIRLLRAEIEAEEERERVEKNNEKMVVDIPKGKNVVNIPKGERMVVDIPMGEEFDDFGEDGDDFDEAEELKNFRKMMNAEQERDKAGGNNDGYAEGEEQYNKWSQENENSDMESSGDADDLASIENFTDADRAYLNSRSDNEDDDTRESLSAGDLTALLKSMGIEDSEFGGGGNDEEDEDEDQHVVQAGMRGAAASLNLNTSRGHAMNDYEADKNRNTDGTMGMKSFQNQSPVTATAPVKSTPESIKKDQERRDMMRLLDMNEDAEDTEAEIVSKAPRSYQDKKRDSYSNEPDIKMFDDFSRGDIDDEWDMVHFGRAPNPDWSVSLKDRRVDNIERAKLLFEEFNTKDIPMNVIFLTSYMSVFTNTMDKFSHLNDFGQQALEIFDSFEKYDIKPDQKTYRSLFRMHIYGKDIQSALSLKEDMVSKGIIPDAESYGLLMQSCGQRDMLVEALKLLEETSERGIQVHDRQIKHLRSRCVGLGIQHPNMPEDPKEW
eukprot:CAMPEP_0119036198 /NCGR_PEP_ID=MMETSP1177-20130426/3729_1 /TAXON_ID=2985 /ORGANISM="Ochromonas sp, Strain CCMP1899" /LENGTH=1120 /DNA_ID=CAMNT_0006995643 /DNA_START=103 /DNA_END=3462 /DNA_ORIENTATION=+